MMLQHYTSRAVVIQLWDSSFLILLFAIVHSLTTLIKPEVGRQIVVTSRTGRCAQLIRPEISEIRTSLALLPPKSLNIHNLLLKLVIGITSD